MLIVRGGSITNAGSGGWINNGQGKVYKNTARVSGGIIKFLYGGGGDQNSSGTISTGITIYENKAEVSGGTIEAVFGGFSSLTNLSNSYGNTVGISGGTIGSVYGGMASTVINNAVIIADGMVNGSVHGGYGYKRAEGNTVEILDGTIKGDVYGGYYGSNGNVEIRNNKVTIKGGIIGGSVYGGTYQEGGGGTASQIY